MCRCDHFIRSSVLNRTCGGVVDAPRIEGSYAERSVHGGTPEHKKYLVSSSSSSTRSLTSDGIQPEVKQILRKRTQFETALIRRIPKKADFLRYVQYEMGLEKLRRKRAERLRECPFFDHRTLSVPRWGGRRRLSLFFFFNGLARRELD